MLIMRVGSSTAASLIASRMGLLDSWSPHIRLVSFIVASLICIYHNHEIRQSGHGTRYERDIFAAEPVGVEALLTLVVCCLSRLQSPSTIITRFEGRLSCSLKVGSLACLLFPPSAWNIMVVPKLCPPKWLNSASSLLTFCSCLIKTTEDIQIASVMAARQKGGEVDRVEHHSLYVHEPR